ncbi:MAG: hypothetical protein PWP08_475 [Methanofollis sp.]|nr:hypothetical protein [Methanofollis sp.]
MAMITVLRLRAPGEAESEPAGEDGVTVMMADTPEDLLNHVAARPFDVVVVPAEIALTPYCNRLAASSGTHPLVVAASEKGHAVIDFETGEEKTDTVTGIVGDIIKRHAKVHDLATFPEEDPDPVMRVGGNGRVLYANEAGKKVLKAWGTDEGGVLPETWQEVVADSLASARITRRDVDLEGSDFTLACVPLPGADCANFYGVDITERKRTENAIQDANRKLNLLNSIIRHDLFNQITVLQGYLDLIRETGEGGPYLDRIAEAAARIRRQVEFGRDYQELGVRGPTWQAAGDEMNNAFLSLSPQGIRLECEVDPRLEVFADPLIGRVFYNLVDNTVRHSKGACTVRFSAEPSENGLSLIYEDDGPGIPEERKKDLFGWPSGKKRGLGMTLSSEILSLTGLSIREEGTAGQGVRFAIAVPPSRFRYREEHP